MTTWEKLRSRWWDFRFHWRRTLCLLAGKHRAQKYIGVFAKPGFRGVPLHQCVYCAEIVIDTADMKKLGGKLAA